MDPGDFYKEYHGHQIQHLEQLHGLLSATNPAGFIYLAGDSSLDNKHWFFKGDKYRQARKKSDFVDDAVNGYENVFSPPLMVKDVAYWINVECARHVASGGERLVCINTAIEESTIVQREESPDGLLAQDLFIRDHITENDVLVIDVGGNDVALRPTAGVIANMALLLYATPQFMIDYNMAIVGGLAYFIHMFRRRLRHYIESMVAIRKPRKVVPCMLYFLDEVPGGSWADGVLEKLGYNDNPAKLQSVIRKVFEWGVKQIHIEGTEVAPLALYETLDGKDHSDYLHRVEPSVTGGQKMGRAIAQKIFE